MTVSREPIGILHINKKTNGNPPFKNGGKSMTKQNFQIGENKYFVQALNEMVNSGLNSREQDIYAACKIYMLSCISFKRKLYLYLMRSVTFIVSIVYRYNCSKICLL